MSKRNLLLVKVLLYLVVSSLMIFAILLIDWKVKPLFKDSKGVVVMFELFFYYGTVKFFINIFEDWKHYEILKRIVMFPECFYPLVIKPYTKMFYGFLTLFFMFMGIYFSLLFLPEKWGHDWKYSTKAFIGIGLSAILLRAFGNTIISYCVKWNYKSENRKEHTELTLTLLNEQRIRYLIYLMFFIALIVFSFIELQMPHLLSHTNEAKAVLAAFGAFLAFDRLIDKTSLINFNPRQHFELLVKVYEKDPKYTDQENYLADMIRRKINNSASNSDTTQ